VLATAFLIGGDLLQDGGAFGVCVVHGEAASPVPIIASFILLIARINVFVFPSSRAVRDHG
jgi:hypothetical protein